MTLAINHNSAAYCFEAEVDGHRCVIDYHLRDKIMTVTHTGVPEQVGGRGIAAVMTQFMLETARSAGWKVVPQCSYTAGYLRKHTEFSDLVN